ncbi:MAG: hypothetical protein Q8M03_15935 [Legionella sp.]|nr:hypothetical protein [Legionella sp.]
MMVIFNRLLEDFNGTAAVIGCTNTPNPHSDCGSGNRVLHANSDIFYSIDFNKDKQPDLVLDITGDLPVFLKNRFQLVLIECVDIPVYNSRPPHKGFDNIWSMVEDNGFILFIGTPRWKNARDYLYSRKLRYIELGAEGVLLPKNQHLTEEEINSTISQLPPELINTIKNASILYNSPVSEYVFCSLKEENFPTLREAIYASSYNEGLKRCIEEFVSTNKEKLTPSLHASLEEFKLKSLAAIEEANENSRYCNKKELQNIAKTTFHHRHDLRRKFLDLLLKATLIAPLLSCITRHSFYFMDAKTSRQKNLETQLNTFESNNK